MKSAVHIFSGWLSIAFVVTNTQASCKVNIQKNFIFQGNLLSSVLVSSQGECEMKCKENSGCFSINYYEKQNKCHLNKATHLSRPLQLVHDMGGIYIKIKNDYCSDAYCSTGHICLIDSGKDDYSCKVCNTPLGLESGRIPNNAIVASSYWSAGHEPWRGRLRAQPTMPYNPSQDAGCWQSKNKAAGEYLQVDLGSIYRVSMVATQGRPYKYNVFVSSYILSYAVTSENFVDYKVDGVVKVFSANTDRDTIVTNKLPEAVRCRYLRIVTVTYSDGPALRAEVYGCPDT